MSEEKKEEKTVHQRVKELVDEYQISQDLQSRAVVSIMELIERAKSPKMFCPMCDTRMSVDLEANTLHCFNCNYRKQLVLPHPITELKQKSEITSDKAKPDKRLLDAIDNAEKDIKPSKKAKSILELASSRGGGSKVTKEDDDFVKGAVPGAGNSKINWV